MEGIKKFMIAYTLLGVLVYTLTYFINDLVIEGVSADASQLSSFNYVNTVFGWANSLQSQMGGNIVWATFGVFFSGIISAVIGFVSVIQVTALLIDDVMGLLKIPSAYWDAIIAGVTIYLLFCIRNLLHNLE